MQTIKSGNGITKVEIKNNVFLFLYKHNGLYELTIQRPTERGRGTISRTICEAKKRLSTINKYASPFGVQFEEEIANSCELTCTCGNATHTGGFFPCDENGNEIEPTISSSWNGLYTRAKCGKIHQTNDKEQEL